ncbi:MAG: Na/Pi cotransporter family protein [Acetatifactor sp.]
MDFFQFLTMLGGLALFLYGMHMLGDGLAKVSGGRFEHVLEKLTNNPLKAVLMGAGVTAVIQSSSATTVMVVGFVNSGIMKLEQAVGVIMGANIGTTITSWILGTQGIESSSFLLKLCKPTSFSPILAIIGVGILMFSKLDKRKNIAVILLGFSVLMFGMDTMSSAVAPLADVPEFTGMLTRFSNPILGMLAGLLLTAVIQSSSASVGILQVLCMTGAVGYDAALPIIMGQNIGTCVTAMLSSVGASKNAKRAALVHLYFNIIGTVLFMVVFYSINAFRPFAFLSEPANTFGIAAIHSIFNVVATICLLPFSRGLVKLAYLTVREMPAGGEGGEAEDSLQLLDVRFLEIPAYAVEQSRTAAVTMSELAEEAVNLSLELLDNYVPETARRVEELEAKVDRYEDELGNYLVKLSARDMSERDSHTLSSILHCIGDFERISDHARNIKEAAEKMQEQKLVFSERAQQELKVFGQAIHDILKITMLGFANEDTALAAQVEPLEEVIDSLNRKIKQRHIKRLQKGKCTIELGFVLADITANLERVADHCSNIALSTLQKQGEEFDPHAYLDSLKRGDNVDFQGKVLAYRERYELP